MTVARHYVINAAEGHDATLETALTRLAEAVRVLPGSEGVELLRDCGNARRFLFIERWESIEVHKSSGKLLPKELMAPVIEALDGPPDGGYFDYLMQV